MDTGEGKFHKFESPFEEQALRKKYPKSKGVFTVGEILEIKESRFKVKDISVWGIKLKLLKPINKEEETYPKCTCRSEVRDQCAFWNGDEDCGCIHP